MHIDAADGRIPISCLLSSASHFDNQVANSLATLSTQRVSYCYELMVVVDDARQIGWHSYLSGHVVIIDVNPSRDAALREDLPPEAKVQRAAGIPDHQ